MSGFPLSGRRLRRLVAAIVLSLLGLLMVLAATGWGLLRGSLPRLDGTLAVPGVAETVRIERDASGVPTVSGGNREDTAFGLGFLHAQDRFFQMDLSRRRAGGRLAALLGPSLVPIDSLDLRHDFRTLARQVLDTVSPASRRLLESYAAGVNAGLNDLRCRPFEYLLLRRKPEPWREEDSILVLYAMFLMLNADDGVPDGHWATVRDALPPDLADYLLARGCRFDAPLDGSVLGLPPLPVHGPPAAEEATAGTMPADVPRSDQAGSNNWAVAGSRTRSGAALVANDMHLALGLPNTWYRAVLEWGEDPGGSGAGWSAGVTLPGLPGVIAGSNGKVAWGFTNSYGDWMDLVILETDPQDPGRYAVPGGFRDFGHRREVIPVAGGEPDTVLFTTTIWGPLYDHDHQGRPRVLRWTAHDSEAANLALIDLAGVADVHEALQVAARCGMPPQNFVCGDRQGHVGWTIAGRIPRRRGWDGRLPVSWADGSCGWDGYLEPDEYPAIIDPAGGLLWTANARMIGGHGLELVGDGGFGSGFRAAQIRDDLAGLADADEKDMLTVQLDDRALLLERWRQLLLEEFAGEELTGGAARFLEQVTDHWEGRAAVSSVSYRLMRECRQWLIGSIYQHLTAPCKRLDEDFDSRTLGCTDAVALDLLVRQPAHLLPPDYESWHAFMRHGMELVVGWTDAGAGGLEEYTWGRRNIVHVAHPFVDLIPRLEPWLAAPPRSLPGDSHMPRVQHPGHGASERFAVSPGREREGLFHMPGGASGHPLSRFFLAGHRDWEEGRAVPFLPGPGRYLLLLEPDANPVE